MIKTRHACHPSPCPLLSDRIASLISGLAFIGSGTESHEYILYPQSIPWTFWISLCSRKSLILW
jgi:hypothetical protein